MPSPKAFLNGQLIEADQMKIAAIDMGFVWGTTVAEQMRTFGGEVFLLDEHLARLCASIQAVGTKIRFSSQELAGQARQLVALNHAQLATDDDLCLVLFVTPGSTGPMGTCEPQVGLHTYPVPFHLWADSYQSGQSLVTSSIRQISPDNWPPSLKCRSRMHYFLADREVQQENPDSRSLLLDNEGFVCEASTANIVSVLEGELVSPKRKKILPGISLGFVEQLAESINLRFRYCDVSPDEFDVASEIFLTSTPFCLLPVTRLDGKQIGGGNSGPVFTRLAIAWSDSVGVDFRMQAQTFARRGARDT